MKKLKRKIDKIKNSNLMYDNNNKNKNSKIKTRF